MAVNNDIRIKALYQLDMLLGKARRGLHKLSTKVMKSKLKPKFNVGDRVVIVIRDTKYIGTALENKKTIYSSGENGFLEVVVKWDNPANNWRNGIFSFNQIHLERLQETV